ncbi:MAG: MAPEG family protein [Pseudomonadota bacterium]|nr:MAPEG family protein [Pseudomonadota bacterium]
MSIAYWCILLAAALPYIWVSIAKAKGERYNNGDPRGWLASQDNPRSHRANAAQLNAFEAFPAFAASVLMAQFAQVDVQRIVWLAMAFVAFRILHGIFYIADKHTLRSVVWFGGFACVIALMWSAAFKVAG